MASELLVSVPSSRVIKLYLPSTELEVCWMRAARGKKATDFAILTCSSSSSSRKNTSQYFLPLVNFQCPQMVVFDNFVQFIIAHLCRRDCGPYSTVIGSPFPLYP